MTISDFRHYIEQALLARQQATPGFPISQFAAEMGLSAQQLNQILKRKSGVSPELGATLAKKLSLKGRDRELFMALVEANHHRSRIVREAAQKRLSELQAHEEFDELSTEEFSVISKWFYVAAAMLVDVVDFKQDYDWIATRLGVTNDMAKEAFEKLFQMGMVYEEDGKWVRDSEKFLVQTRSSDENLQNFHRELLSIADRTLATVEPSKRQFSSSVISISESDLEFAREQTDMFRRKLINDISQRPGNVERIYGLSVQLFPVDTLDLKSIKGTPSC